MDYATWDQFLKQFVNAEGQVDYRAVQANPELLHKFQAELRDDGTTFLYQDSSREEKLAFWLNAYHFGVIRLIHEHYPLRSIHDIPGAWDLPIVEIGREAYSLNQIRDRQLLQVYRDEKIHLALACGAESCPSFRQEAFVGGRVEGQLFLATREFVNNPDYVKIIPGEKKIWLSRIFKWYASDFKLDFGSSEDILNFSPEEAAVLSFIVHYLEDLSKIEYLEEGKFKIQYMPFEWRLNEAMPVSAA